jgi:ribonuclease P/MRP protein subunit RPP1
LKRRDFYDLGIRCRDERVKSFAFELGFKDIWIFSEPDNFEGGPLLLNPLNRKEFKKLIAKYHSKASIIAILSSNMKNDRAFIRNDFVHILYGAHRYRFDRSFVRDIEENNIAVLFDLSTLLEKGRQRSVSIYRMRHNYFLLKKRDIPILLSSGAKNIFSMRPPDEMIAMASLFDMEEDDALRALSDDAERIRKRTSPNYIREGVEVVEKGYER